MPFQPPRTQAAVGNEQGIEKHNVVIEESRPIEITRPKKAAKGKGKATVKAHGTGKRVSQRGKSFNKEEDRIICSAFLNVSKDPITGLSPYLEHGIILSITCTHNIHLVSYLCVGTNQSSGGYYQRMHEYFAENMDIPTTRSQLAISNRWLAIQRAVNKFCGFFSTVERLDASGKTEKDRVSHLLQPIVHSFHPYHCVFIHYIIHYRLMTLLKCLRRKNHGRSVIAGTFSGMNQNGTIRC